MDFLMLNAELANKNNGNNKIFLKILKLCDKLYIMWEEDIAKY